jgi:putative membrane protein
MIMKTKKLLIAGCLLAGVVFAACNDDDEETSLNNADTTFMMQASLSNSAEDSAGTVALTKGTNTAVKAFASHMLAEHSVAQVDLKNLGNNIGYPIRDTLDPLHKLKGDTLKSLPAGRRFDSVYIWNQVIDHQNTIANFQVHQANGQHRDVKAYNTNNLPHIQSHLTRADSIARAYFPR